jgi:branched-chain amino acid transport system substrate-binding protein
MKQLNAAGLGKSVKVVFYAVDENVLGAMGETGVGALEATAYFYDLPSKQNKQFLQKYFNKFGSGAQKPNFMAVPTYDAIHLWGLAAKKAKSIETRKVRDQICNVTFQSPRGSIRYDPDSQHAKLPIYIGEGQADGRFKVIKELGVISPMGK